MKERPILFSGAMVRSLLNCTKSQTRRVVKGLALEWLTMHNGFSAEFVALPENHLCPYGQPGDRLWVRETWAFHKMAIGSVCDEDWPVVYRATDGEQSRLCDRWRPSIHMPRYAGRILLEITGVRIERLQDISEADAEAEGIETVRVSETCFRYVDYLCSGKMDEKEATVGAAIKSYATLWESINGPGSWAANPWVWVVKIKRVEL